MKAEISHFKLQLDYDDEKLALICYDIETIEAKLAQLNQAKAQLNQEERELNSEATRLINKIMDGFSAH